MIFVSVILFVLRAYLLVGSQLQESIVLRVILIVYTLFFCLPALPYVPQDKGLYFVTKVMQSLNMDTSLSHIIKKQMITDIISWIQRQYGSSVIISLIITPFLPEPFICDSNRLLSLRADEIVTIAFHSYGVNGTEFSTTMMIDRHGYYMSKAGEYFTFALIADKCWCCIQSNYTKIKSFLLLNTWTHYWIYLFTVFNTTLFLLLQPTEWKRSNLYHKLRKKHYHIVVLTMIDFRKFDFFHFSLFTFFYCLFSFQFVRVQHISLLLYSFYNHHWIWCHYRW